MIVMCISWMRAVCSDGTGSTRIAVSASRPPRAPVRPRVRAPSARAARMPRTTFSESPEVLMPTTTSDGRQSASTWRFEDGIGIVVVGDGGEDGRVRGQGQRRKASTMTAEMAHQLGREVLGIGGAATIAEDDELAV